MVPLTTRSAGHIELHHLSVPLEVEIIRGADVAHVLMELHRLPGPEHGQAGVEVGLGWVEAGGPDTGIQAVLWSEWSTLIGPDHRDTVLSLVEPYSAGAKVYAITTQGHFMPFIVLF